MLSAPPKGARIRNSLIIHFFSLVCVRWWVKCSMGLNDCNANDKRPKPQKSPFLGTFTSMTSRDDVIMAKQKQIWNQPAKTFHMRYHTTLSDFRIKFCQFSAHYDVTMGVFPEWVTSSKVGPFLNEGPCQVSSNFSYLSKRNPNNPWYKRWISYPRWYKTY